MATTYTDRITTAGAKSGVRSLADIPVRSGGAIREAVTLALDAIWRNKLRSSLTMLGIVIAVSTVIIISSVINGLNSNVISSVESIGSNVIICYRFPWASTGRPPTEWFQRKELEADWAEEIALLPGVEAASPSLRIFRPEFGAGTSYVRRGDLRSKNVILQGNPPEIQQVLNVTMQSGRWFTKVDSDHRNNVVVLGHDTAKTLFPNGEEPVGKEVLVEGKVFTVVGVQDIQKSAIGGGANPEDNIAILPLTTLRKMFPNQKDHVIFIKAKSADLVPQVVDSTRDLLRRKRKLASNKPDDFAIFTPDAFIDLWKQITGMIFFVTFGVGSVGLLVGGIGVMNIMLVSVTERTREIGIRKAIGAKRRNILMQFLLEATTLAGVGGVIGILMGAMLALLVRAVFPALPATVTAFWVLVALGVSGAIGILFGSYPAWKAARLDPVEALRYE
ncbi:MAG: ABC transporter permease [Acidobacteria bacterium]|nr:ABC transporter permease [Acidobacteriota bacterium]